MIIDSGTLESNHTISADICIVGAGVSGISLAYEFIKSGFDVVIMESGGMEPNPFMQSLNQGKNIGQKYYDLDTTRTRAFGGTSHRWHVDIGRERLGVRLRGLDAMDFEKRDWVPYSGWPFPKSHLEPFYKRAHDFLRIGPYDRSNEFWEDPEFRPKLQFAGDTIETRIFQFARREILFENYHGEINEAKNIRVYLNSTVTEIETTENAGEVTRLSVHGIGGKRYWVKARHYVLASGGLEIPRLLLLSNRTIKQGLGNQNDLVGRFFMEHPHLWPAMYYPSRPDIFLKTNLYSIHDVDGTTISGKLSLSESVIKKERLLNFTTSMHPAVMLRTSEGVRDLERFFMHIKRAKFTRSSLKNIMNLLSRLDEVAVAGAARVMGKKRDDLSGPFWKYHGYKLNVMSEQSPNPESRIILDTERDMLGQNRIILNWKLTTLDIQSIRTSLIIMKREFDKSGLGNIDINLIDDQPPDNIHGGWHNMGTTRMHTDPRSGVVNEDCRLHTVNNLYIAGASVFPTVGYANPVLTTVALAIRLADHLKRNG
jgi:choline dehydrogenase-like flavoprotein